MNLNNSAIRSPRLLAAAAGALLASVALASPASAAVAPGHAITAFHNSDIVIAEGYNEASTMTVDVLRNGVRIGTATGPTQDTPGGRGLEVNHGPLAAAKPGDCWDNVVPDMLSGDLIRITSHGSGGAVVNIDEMNVADVNFTGDAPRELPNGDIVVEGSATVPANQLAGEVRVGNAFRAAASATAGAAPQSWIATYVAAANPAYGTFRNRNNDDPKQSVLDGAHSMTYAAGNETTIAELVGEGGPVNGPGCGASLVANAVVGADSPSVNIDSGNLVLSGTAREGTATVAGTIASAGGGSIPFDGALSTNATGQKTWTVEIPRTEIDKLNDGMLTASAQYTSPEGTINGAALKIDKDTVAPAAATATPGPGTYQRAQSVSLNAEAGTQIRYTVGGSVPNTVYSGQIQVTASQTIKAIVVDKAGNASGIASFAYVIDAPALRTAPAIPAQPQRAGIPAIRAIPASISSLRSASALRLTTARSSGIAASFSSNGVATAELRLYSLKGGRKLVSTKRVGLADGAHSVRLSSRGMRKRLASGRYSLEVSTAGKVIRKTIRIVA